MDLAPDWPAERVEKSLQQKSTAKVSEFLRDRYNARFLDPIECLRTASDTYDGYGFSMMALCCLLVETLQCYREGMPTTHEAEWLHLVKIQKDESVQSEYLLQEQLPKNGRAVFEQFFRDFQGSFPNVDGRDFYQNIRNGLLHQAQTKNGWVVNAKGSSICEPAPKKSINRNLFAEALTRTFGGYIVGLSEKPWECPEWGRAATKVWWLIRISR